MLSHRSKELGLAKIEGCQAAWIATTRRSAITLLKVTVLLSATFAVSSAMAGAVMVASSAVVMKF